MLRQKRYILAGIPFRERSVESLSTHNRRQEKQLPVLLRAEDRVIEHEAAHIDVARQEREL